jgi:hypothetical protein
VSGNPDIQPTWPLLLKTEKVDEILIVFLLNYWANPPFLFLVTATMLVEGQDCRTPFWKGITHEPFHQSLVSSGKL